MSVATESPETLIILAADQASLYEFLQTRQRANGGSVEVILDRRVRDRRVRAVPVTRERRRQERRGQLPEAALALMRVLGFAILHRAGERYTV